MFSEQKGKPMVIPETGAWYNLCDDNAGACAGNVSGLAWPGLARCSQCIAHS